MFTIHFWQVWAVEHANNIVGRHRPPFMYPRLVCWNNTPSPRRVDVIANVMKNLKRFEVIEKLEPREEELHLLSQGRPQLLRPVERRTDSEQQQSVHVGTQVPSSSQSDRHPLQGIHTRITMLETCLLQHGFSLPDPHPIGDVENTRIEQLDKRVSTIEKVLRDKGLLVDDKPGEHVTVPAEEHTTVAPPIHDDALQKDHMQHSADSVEVIWSTDAEAKKKAGAPSSYVSSLCKRVKLGARERKPSEKVKAISQHPKTYKRAKKKVKVAQIGEVCTENTI
ncbi:uncharacterized protein LOC120110581 [Phoenix dactylifera]|uniref:Uncharacterized protein LOC120110581 n=1 Tax=Phoenix dactylifera TaxID=42345 RepID=A0A8B9AF55_PHODC|nr:uncharacterized protein LOC120110581 [Phoenix dactylifera]XP_038981864.1 uncharacterized protein LOC120110581 [Phoenix dactylifera]